MRTTGAACTVCAATTTKSNTSHSINGTCTAAKRFTVAVDIADVVNNVVDVAVDGAEDIV